MMENVVEEEEQNNMMEEQNNEEGNQGLLVGEEGEEGEEEDNNNGGPHPLLIPHVLTSIFSNFTAPRTLETCRLVCRDWNEEAIPVLRSQKLVALLDIESVKHYVEKHHSVIPGTSYFPHERFEFQMENLQVEVMTDFFRKFGPVIKYVEFKQNVLQMEVLFTILHHYLANLETLYLKAVPQHQRQRRPELPADLPPEVVDRLLMRLRQREEMEPNNFNWDNLQSLRFGTIRTLTLNFCEEDALDNLRELLTSLPGLEAFNINAPDSPAKERLASTFLQVLTSDLPFTNLQTVNFILDVNNDDLNALKSKQMRLTNLKLRVKSGTRSASLKEFLTSISNTLQLLQVDFPVNFFGLGISFPAYSLMNPAESAEHLKNVKNLSLNNFSGPINFTRLRNLQELTINGKNFRPHFTMENTDLKSFKTDAKMDSAVMNSITSCFPFLGTIKVNGLTDFDLGIIYRHLPFLQELEIVDGSVTDEGLSGVPQEVCNDMAETQTFHFVEAAMFRTNLFLGSLPSLTTLRLLNCPEISNISVFFAVLDCSKLETLVLNCGKVTDLSLFKLADEISSLNRLNNLSHLDVHQCSSITEEGKFYMKEKIGKKIRSVVVDEVKQKTANDNQWRQVGFPGNDIRMANAPIPNDDVLDRRRQQLIMMGRRRQGMGNGNINIEGGLEGPAPPLRRHMDHGGAAAARGARIPFERMVLDEDDDLLLRFGGRNREGEAPFNNEDILGRFIEEPERDLVFLGMRNEAAHDREHEILWDDL